MELLIDKFNEVKDIVPLDRMCSNGGDGQTLYGDVLDWCRDYFGCPKDSVLAYMLVGYWYCEIEYLKMLANQGRKSK